MEKQTFKDIEEAYNVSFTAYLDAMEQFENYVVETLTEEE